MNLEQFADNMRKSVMAKIRTLKAMDGITIAVGIDPSAKYPDGKSVAEVAELVEYGTRYMPPRPFMRNAKAEKEASWRGMLRRAVARSVKDGTPIGTLLVPIAERMKSDVQESVMAEGAYRTGRLHDSVIASVGTGTGGL